MTLSLRSIPCALAAVTLIASAAPTQERAPDVLGRARNALGGEAVLAGLTSLSVNCTVRRVVPAMNMELSSDVQIELLLPDKYRRTESVSVGPISRTVVTAIDGSELFYDDGGAAAAMGMDPAAPGPQREMAIKNLKQDASRFLTLWLLSPPAGATVTSAGVAEAPDGKADVLDVTVADTPALRLFLDTGTHRLLMATYETETVDPEQVKAITQKAVEQAKANPGEARNLAQSLRDEVEKLPKKKATVQMFFSDHRPDGGVTLPHKMTVDTGMGQEEWTISSFKLNPPLKADRFRR